MLGVLSDRLRSTTVSTSVLGWGCLYIPYPQPPCSLLVPHSPLPLNQTDIPMQSHPNWLQAIFFHAFLHGLT